MARFALLENNLTAAIEEDYIRNEIAAGTHIGGPSFHKFILEFYGIELGPNRLPRLNSSPAQKVALKKYLDSTTFFQDGCHWPHQ